MTALRSLQTIHLSQVLLMFILGVMTGLIYMTLTPIWWLVFLGIAIMIAVFTNNQTGVLIILATLFIFHWLFGVFKIIPKEITWLPDVIILVMASKFLYLRANKRQWQSTPIDYVILAIIVLGLLSAIYNSVSLVTIMFGFRKFFKFTLMFLILRNIEHDAKFYRFFLISLFVLALLQIPVTIVQAIIFGTVGRDVADKVSGTLGWKATGAMALFMCFVMSMMMGFYTQTKKYIYLLLCVAFIIPIILGSGQFGFFIAPIAVVICWLLGNRISLISLARLPLFIIIMAMFIIPGINYHDSRYQGNLSKFITSPSEVYSLNIQTRKEGTFGRFEVIDVAHQLLFENLPQLLIGFGPGNASESYFSDYSGQLEKKYPGLKIWGVQYTATILEYGFLGLLLFLFMFYRLWRANRKFFHQTEDPFWRAVSVGYNGVLFTYLAGCLYNPAWYYDILAFTFWFISAALVVQANKAMDETSQAKRISDKIKSRTLTKKLPGRN